MFQGPQITSLIRLYQEELVNGRKVYSQHLFSSTMQDLGGIDIPFFLYVQIYTTHYEGLIYTKDKRYIIT